MHPAENRRRRHEEARKTGTLDVHRHGRKIATLNLGEPQGTRQVRPWIVSMVEGKGECPGVYFAVIDAERGAIAAAVSAEAKLRKTDPDKKARFDAVGGANRATACRNLS